MGEALYRRVLGNQFDLLALSVRKLHDLKGRSVWSGRADVERGTSLVARLGALVAGLPPTGSDQPLTVTFSVEHDRENWRRAFGDAVFLTQQSLGKGVILERTGPVQLTLVPEVHNGHLLLRLGRMHMLGVPVPRSLMPIVSTREFEQDGRYRFEVESRLPLFGLLVRYSGWLEQEQASMR